jgi:hypothetical protein
MPSFVTDAEKLAWSSEFDNLHQTFARDVVIYRNPQRVDVVTTNDYIYAYRDFKQGQNMQYNTIPVSGTFGMRIQWLDPKNEKNLPIDIKVPGEACRLKMKKDAYDFLSGCQSFYIDGVSCEIVGAPKMHGLFNVDFYTLYVRRRDMQ